METKPMERDGQIRMNPLTRVLLNNMEQKEVQELLLEEDQELPLNHKLKLIQDHKLALEVNQATVDLWEVLHNNNNKNHPPKEVPMVIYHQ